MKKIRYLNFLRNNVYNVMQNIIQKIINIIFPIHCISCNKEDTLLCYKCLKKIHTRLNNSQLSSKLEAYSAYGYKIPLIKKLIIRAKYNNTPKIFESLTLHAIPTLSPIFSLYKNKKIILIPVPLHIIRKQKRGFNQSKIIANTLADTFENTEVIDLVLRTKNTPQQAKLNKAKRIKNTKNSFEINKTHLNHPLNIYKYIIIDDVISTGSTILEIEKLLIQKLNISKKDILAVSLCRG